MLDFGEKKLNHAQNRFSHECKVFAQETMGAFDGF